MELCKVCEPFPRPVYDPRHYEGEGIILSPKGLEQWPLFPFDKKKHTARRIVAEYDIKPMPKCQYCGQSHIDGCVVETCCDKFYRIGHKCASREVEGYIKARDSRTKGIQIGQEKARLRTSPTEFLNKCAVVRPFIGQLAQFRKRLGQYVPEVDDELASRAKKHDSTLIEEVKLTAKEIDIRRAAGLPLQEFRREPIEGIAAGDATLNPRRLARFVTEFESLKIAVAMAEPEFSNRGALLAQLIALDRKARNLFDDAKEAKKLFYGDALDRLLRATKQALRSRGRSLPYALRAAGDHYVLTLGGSELKIGLSP